MKAVIYTRISTEYQEEGHSQDEQLRRCKAKIERMRDLENIDVEFVGHYHDTASGSNFEKRPSYSAMMQGAGTEWNLILFYHLDRLHRNLLNQILWLDDLRANDCDFLSLSQPHMNSTGPEGELLFYIMASFAEYQRKDTAKKVRMGMEGARRARRNIGTPPYGYKIDDSYTDQGTRENTGALLPNLEGMHEDGSGTEVYAVQQILVGYAEGKSISRIITDLIKQGIETRTGLLVWHRSTVEAIIERMPLYTVGSGQDGRAFSQPAIAGLDRFPMLEAHLECYTEDGEQISAGSSFGSSLTEHHTVKFRPRESSNGNPVVAGSTPEEE